MKIREKKAAKEAAKELQNQENGGKAKKGKKRKKAPIIISIIVVVFLIFTAVSCSMSSDAGAYVTTTTATRGEIQESVSTSGTVSSERQEVIFAQVGGKLAKVNVTAGDGIKKGETLISYDMETAEDMLKQASLQQNKSNAGYDAAMSDNSKNQAKLNEANTNLGVLEQQLTDWNAYLDDLEEELSEHQRVNGNALAEESYNLATRSEELQAELEALDKTDKSYEKKAAKIKEELQEVSEDISYNQYKQQTVGTSDYVAEMQSEIARVQGEIAEFEKYKAEMESQKASSEGIVMDSYDKEQYAVDKELAAMSYEEAEADYNQAKKGVVAEFDGIVMECSAVEGSTVTEGMQLLTIASSQEVKVTFSASKHDVEKLEEGQKADVIVSGNTYEGTISKIDRMATLNASNTPMVGVEIHIENPDDKIILGLDARLEIYTDKAENALLIPVEAINADKEGDFLYVVENGVVVRKPIVCGISSDTQTEVLEGITEADQIIVSSLTGIEEGMAVVVMPSQTVVEQ